MLGSDVNGWASVYILEGARANVSGYGVEGVIVKNFSEIYWKNV